MERSPAHNGQRWCDAAGGEAGRLSTGMVYYAHIMSAIDHKPHLTMDDGCDLVSILRRGSGISTVVRPTPICCTRPGSALRIHR
ncbi:MAG TPA: hypothetical protein VFN62_05545 [Acidobacteriaceae bacterium]|nr:hypothetical protein [Acidobacteriaceae bacterium]